MMAAVFEQDTAANKNDGVADLVTKAAAELRAGGAVIIPTDTVYGLAALPNNEALLFELKQRPANKAVAILVADPSSVAEFFDPLPATRMLIEQFWPGALTIIQDGKGVRCPDHQLVQALVTEVGPIATTSANLSGQPTPHTAQAAATAFPAVSVVIDGGRLDALASTVVEVTQAGFSILRRGAVDVDTLAQ